MNRVRWAGLQAAKPPEHLPCANCRERPATTRWIGSGGAWALSHGDYTWWCEVCVLEAQVEHARERAAALPDLERRYQAARAAACDHLWEGPKKDAAGVPVGPWVSGLICFKCGSIKAEEEEAC